MVVGDEGSLVYEPSTFSVTFALPHLPSYLNSLISKMFHMPPNSFSSIWQNCFPFPQVFTAHTRPLEGFTSTPSVILGKSFFFFPLKGITVPVLKIISPTSL